MVLGRVRSCTADGAVNRGSLTQSWEEGTDMQTPDIADRFVCEEGLSTRGTCRTGFLTAGEGAAAAAETGGPGLTPGEGETVVLLLSTCSMACLYSRMSCVRLTWV